MQQEIEGMLSCLEHYSLLLEQPLEKNMTSFLDRANAISQNEQIYSRNYKQLCDMADGLLDKYIQTKNSLYKETFQKLDVCFNGRDAEDHVISRIKQWLKRPSGRNHQAIRLMMSKSRYPSWTKKCVNRRILLLPFRKLGKLFDNIRFGFVLAGLRRRFGYSRLTLRAWEKMKLRDKERNPRGDRSAMKWAHKHGFLYSRISQYKLTDKNYKYFISDRDYILINPINNSYVKWIEDIPSMRYCLAELKDHLPKMYYHVLVNGKKRLFVRMPDCPEGYAGDNADEVLRLLREKGELTFRPAKYGQGTAIYNFYFRDGLYYIDFRQVSEQDIFLKLTGQSYPYVLLERTVMYDRFNEVGGTAVKELRALIIDPDVSDPNIVALHISKANDDVIDVDPMTGRFSDGEIPNWETYREQVMHICRSIPQLEYYAITLKLRNKVSV